MREFIVSLRGVSDYGQNRYYETPKLPKETHLDYEDRTWRDRLHVNEDGYVFIPPTAFKNCLSECAKYLSIQIPGKGKSTYTKHFEAGVLVTEPVVLPIKKEEVQKYPQLVPADGTRGGKKRVMKNFPVIHNWKADVRFLIFDETITKKVFADHIKQAGQFIGIGVFRPRNNGYWGRFAVDNIEEIEQDM